MGSQQGSDRQADPVDRNLSFFNNIATARLRIFDLQIPCVALAVEPADSPQTVDVTLNNVTSESRVSAHGAFQIHDGALYQASQARSIECLSRQLRRELVSRDRSRREADAVHGNARADGQIAHDIASVDM